jgi:ABC-type dipeptide/oligopeptide/nickel transport system ATPase component
MKDERILEYGNYKMIRNNTQHPFIEELKSSVPTIKCRQTFAKIKFDLLLDWQILKSI